jgi:hypothetical protein
LDSALALRRYHRLGALQPVLAIRARRCRDARSVVQAGSTTSQYSMVSVIATSMPDGEEILPAQPAPHRF